MQLIEVQDKKTRKEFLDVARILYKNDPNWICPLDKQVEGIFIPGENPFFSHGEAIRWILKNEQGQLVGRVAAFINRKKAYGFQQPTGGMGFFECINDREAAWILFDRCRDWLSERGMQAMDGPVNFGENDNFWGLLVEGFIPPSYGMAYNHPYYRDLFEGYGFKTYFEQVTNVLDIVKPFPERFWKIADRVLQNHEYSFRHFTFREKENFFKDFCHVYNLAWVNHENYTPISENEIRSMFEKAKFLIDEDLIWFAYSGAEPIAMHIMLPDFNQAFRNLNGKLNLWSKLKILWLKKFRHITRIRAVVFGIIPKYQNRGIESGIFRELQKVHERKPWYTEIELSWVGDFNPKMSALHEAVGSTFSKKHITYRKLFSDDLAFNRSSIINHNKQKPPETTD